MADTTLNKDIYKIYQLMEFFTNKYSFNNVMVKDYISKNEVWLVNPKNKEFTVIRISLSTLDSTFINKDRIEKYLKSISKPIKMETKFLDIHISNEEVYDNELFNTICINTNYYSGLDVSYEFIGIKNVIHDVDNPEKEIASRIFSINENLKAHAKQARQLFKQKFSINATSIIEFVCIFVFLMLYYFKNLYSDSTAYVVCGADYKMFTLGLHQYWRLFTHAFVHSGLLHLICNIYSLHILGNFFERKYGTVKYLIILFLGIIVGALTNGVLTGTSNELSLGLSGGIYALFACYIFEAIKLGAYKDTGFLTMILLNICLNFMPNVAWQAHLGGALVGVLFNYAFIDNKIDMKIIVLICVVVLALGYKYITIEDIAPIYAGTDAEIIKAYSGIGLDSFANSIEKALYNVYIK